MTVDRLAAGAFGTMAEEYERGRPGWPGVRSLAGTAEAIPLADGSVDAVFVGEAFHWFDLGRAPAEIARVLRPGGGLAVMWNVADDDGEPWFDEIALRYRTTITTARRVDG